MMFQLLLPMSRVLLLCRQDLLRQRVLLGAPEGLCGRGDAAARTCPLKHLGGCWLRWRPLHRQGRQGVLLLRTSRGAKAGMDDDLPPSSPSQPSCLRAFVFAVADRVALLVTLCLSSSTESSSGVLMLLLRLRWNNRPSMSVWVTPRLLGWSSGGLSRNRRSSCGPSPAPTSHSSGSLLSAKCGRCVLLTPGGSPPFTPSCCFGVRCSLPCNSCCCARLLQDPQDEGPGYRNLIGVPGGMNSALMDVIAVSSLPPSPLALHPPPPPPPLHYHHPAPPPFPSLIDSCQAVLLGSIRCAS